MSAAASPTTIHTVRRDLPRGFGPLTPSTLPDACFCTRPYSPSLPPVSSPRQLAEAAAPSGPLIYAHVIDLHLRGELCRGVGVAREVAADRQIQDDRERVIVDPLSPGWKVCGRARLIQLVIDVPTDHVPLPLGREGVEPVGEALTRRQRVRLGDRIAAAVSGAVETAIDPRWILPENLHHV